MTPDESLRIDRELAERLPRTWPAFFQRFGRLTEIQRKTIPEILEGRDTLICAATATGKTEAVCAPLVESRLDQREPWSILYVSPTRALVNDLFVRLESPLAAPRRTGRTPDR